MILILSISILFIVFLFAFIELLRKKEVNAIFILFGIIVFQIIINYYLYFSLIFNNELYGDIKSIYDIFLSKYEIYPFAVGFSYIILSFSLLLICQYIIHYL